MDETVEPESTALITEVDSIKAIATADQYSRVATLRGLIKAMVNKITESKKPGIDSAKAHLELLKQELSDDIDPLNQKYEMLGGLLSIYNTAQERLKKKRELEIDAENKRKAEAEKQQLAALATDLGDKKLAKEIMKAPVDLPPVVVTKDVPKVEGLSYAESWHYEVINLTELLAAVVNGLCCEQDGKLIEFYVFKKVDDGKLQALPDAGRIPIQALTDPSKPFRSGYLHKQATALKSMLNYPGVRVWMTKDPRQS